MSTRHKRLVRIFFNTYYEDDARRLLDELRQLGELDVKRSINVPELYYVELKPRDGLELEEAEKAVHDIFRRAPSSVFGVKIYSVRT